MVKFFPVEDEKKITTQFQSHVHKRNLLVGHLLFPFPTNWKEDSMVLGHLCPRGQGLCSRRLQNNKMEGRWVLEDHVGQATWLSSLDSYKRGKHASHLVHVADDSFLKHLNSTFYKMSYLKMTLYLNIFIS